MHHRTIHGLELDGIQTLMEPDEIIETIAHELGHNFGLPHNIEHDSIMSTIQDSDVRTYYEVHGLNVPEEIEEHTHDNNIEDTEEMGNEEIAEKVAKEVIEEIGEKELCEMVYDDADICDILYPDDELIDVDEIPTDIDEIIKHPTVTEFIEFMQAVTDNMTRFNGLMLWLDITGLITDAIFS